MSEDTEKNERAENNGGISGPTLVPGPRGGALKTGGTPGNKGGGRPPNEYKAMLARMLNQRSVQEYRNRALKGDFGPKIQRIALRDVEDRVYGRAVQPVTGEDGGPVQVEVIRKIVNADDPTGD
jgi:hypothetical protein